MNGAFPNVRTPSADQIRKIGAEFGLDLSEAEVAYLSELVAENLPEYERIDELTMSSRPTDRERGAGYRPDDEEDLHSAWVRKCHVPSDDGAPSTATRSVSGTASRLAASR